MKAGGTGESGGGAGGALLRAFRKQRGDGMGLALGGGLTLSQSQNKDISMGGAGGMKGGSGSVPQLRARECREEFIAMECPVQAIRDAGDDLQDLLRAMLLATECEDKMERGEKLVMPVALACIEDASLVAGRRGKEIIDFVVNEIDRMHPNKCVELMETLLNNISRDGEKRTCPETKERYTVEVDTRCFDLIPKLLMTISKETTVKFPNKHREETGPGYKYYVIEQLYRIEWPKRLCLAIADTIRYLNVSPGQLEHCVQKMLDESKKLNKQDLPHLVYHVLLLSSQGERVSILRKVLDLINDLDEKFAAELGGACAEMNLSQVDAVRSDGGEEDICLAEGMILQHFDFSAKQDQGMGVDILKVLKQRQCQLSAFEVALLMQMLSVQRYEALVIQILRKAAEQDYTYQVKVKTSSWIAGIKGLQAPSSFQDAAKVVLKRTRLGWEHLVPGLVGFARTMLCTYAKKSNEGHSLDLECKTVPQRVVHLSMTLLEKAFTLHPAVREEILSQILSRVISRDETVSHFITLLSKISIRCSRDVMDNIPKVKDAIEYISFMSPKTAVTFLDALAPIMRIQTGLHDYLIIVLRKALFSREPEARVVALDCLLYLASAHTPPADANLGGSSSGRVAPVSDALTVDILSQLRRCMVQQLAVRQRLYDGLYDMTLSKPGMLDTIASIVTPHLLKYTVQGDDGSFELEVRRCMDRAVTTEPLPHLMRCAVRCLHAYSELLVAGGSSMQGALVGGDESLLKLRRVMEGISAFLADFDLDLLELEQIKVGGDVKGVAQANFDAVNKGDEVLSEARLWYGAYEVMLEHALLCQHVTVVHLEGRCKKLFDRMQKIENAIRPKGKGQLDLPPTLLTCDFTALLLSCTKHHGDVRFEGKARIAAFSNIDLVVHGLRTCSRQIQGLKLQLQQDDGRKSRALSDLKRVAPLLVRQFYANLSENRVLPLPLGQNLKKKDGEDRATKSVATIALVGLQACLELVCTRGSKAEMSEVAAAIVGEVQESRCSEAILPEDSVSQIGGQNHSINNCICRMQSMVRRLIDDDDKEQAACVLSCMLHVLRSISVEERECHFLWFEQLNKDMATGSGRWKDSMVKDIATWHLSLSSGEKDLSTAVKLAQDVKLIVRGEGESEHGILGANEKECKVGISAIADFVKGCCMEVDWVLAHVESMSRLDMRTDDKLSDDPLYVQAARDINATEDEAMVRLHRLVLVLIPLAESPLEVPACLASVIETLHHVYLSAEGAAKRVLRAQTKPRDKFSALMRTIGSKLTKKMYASIDSFAKAGNDEEGGSLRASSKAQCSKEQKLVPNIIFSVESLEKHLIKISNKAQGVDLMEGFKRSQARDFKVDFNKITIPDKKKKGKENGKGDCNEEDAEDVGKGAGKKKRNLKDNDGGFKKKKRISS